MIQGCAPTVIHVATETVEITIELTGAVIRAAVEVIVPGGDDEDSAE